MKTLSVVMISVLCASGIAWTEEPVPFADPRLKAAVERELGIMDPTPTNMLGLLILEAASSQISDLTGLEYAKNAQVLSLTSNQITDISALSGLHNLETLILNANEICDLSPLSGLLRLESLDLHQNKLTDLSPLSGLPKLRTLALRENPLSDISPLSSLKNLGSLSILNTSVSDLSPLASLTSLRSLDVRGCPLSQESFDVIIPQIKANNPGIRIEMDSHAKRLLSLSSGAGGSVTDPGEGDFLYEDDALIVIEAKPHPSFIFAGWTGTYPSSWDSISVRMDKDLQFRANFQSILDVLHVDDNASADPGPGDPALSDPNEDGTPGHPFDRLQEAIEVAGPDVSIVVHPGLYRENIDMLGKTLHLMGIDPNGPNAGPAAVLEGIGAGPVVRFAGSSLSSSLTGFVTSRSGSNGTFTGFIVMQGRDPSAGAILCDNSSPTIANCLIVGNRSTDPDGATICCIDSQAVLTNCTIADNYNGPQGAALVLVDSDVTVTNSILWGNSPREILIKGQSDPLIRYCDVQGWWPDYGNLSSDPLFARRGSWVSAGTPQEPLSPASNQAVWRTGDYHLKSQAGRWEADGRTWVQDAVSSPCIDGGDPSSPVGAEPAPNGDILNLGAYGGTTQASKTSGKTASP